MRCWGGEERIIKRPLKSGLVMNARKPFQPTAPPPRYEPSASSSGGDFNANSTVEGVSGSNPTFLYVQSPFQKGGTMAT